ncbi:MAG: lamin tail domain-containing protein [Labilithrix sp.]|nr:lamin tail domain-containing protein [Labilithrix sp.]
MSVSAALGIIAACAQGQDGIDVSGGVVPADDAGAEGGTRLPGTDAGGSSSGDPDPDPEDDSGAGPGCTGKVVINEIMTRGASAAHEFVELYNPNSCALSLGGWTLVYRSRMGTTDTALHAFAGGASIPAQSFLVVGSAQFAGPKDVSMNVGTTGKMAEEGQVGLINDSGSLVDALGFGGATGAYVEGTAAGSPPVNGSVGRKSDGLDTDNNAADCRVFTTHSAGASNL